MLNHRLTLLFCFKTGFAILHWWVISVAKTVVGILWIKRGPFYFSLPHMTDLIICRKYTLINCKECVCSNLRRVVRLAGNHLSGSQGVRPDTRWILIRPRPSSSNKICLWLREWVRIKNFYVQGPDCNWIKYGKSIVLRSWW